MMRNEHAARRKLPILKIASSRTTIIAFLACFGLQLLHFWIIIYYTIGVGSSTPTPRVFGVVQNSTANEVVLPPTLTFPRVESLPKRPILILHVGPPKTGTTSLQHMIGVLEQTLLEDNYFYAGNSSFVGVFNKCIRRVRRNPGEKHECWTSILTSFENHRASGHNLIFSNELLALRAIGDLDLLRSFIDPWMPNVLVVVGYRHLHNFFHSTHFELYKIQRWPSMLEQGRFVIPFVRFWNEQHGKDQVGIMPTPATTISMFRQRQYNVSVLNVETTEQISEFFCHILPQADRTCQYHKEHNSSIIILNKKEEGRLNYDALAIIAFQRQMLKKSQTRPYVRSRIEQFNTQVLGRGPNDFEMYCLDAAQEKQFLEESIDHARLAGIDNVDDDIRSTFAKAVEKKKFCSINAVEVFEQKVWLDFFKKAKTW